MPQSEFEEQFAELTRELNELEAKLAASALGKHFADLKRRIKVLYEAMRESRLLLETVLENSAASIYAKQFAGGDILQMLDDMAVMRRWLIITRARELDHAAADFLASQ
jgi:hypothetical protein